MNELDERPRRSLDASTVAIALFLVFLWGGVIGVKPWLEGRRHRNEAAAISSLKSLGTAEAIFREGDKENDGNLDYGMLSELDRAGLVDPEVGAGRRQGYTFQATYSFNTSEFLWFGSANPTRPGFTGDRYFTTNHTGVIFYATGANILPDTDTCLLPNNGVCPNGGK
jgi:hypothetical protein